MNKNIEKKLNCMSDVHLFKENIISLQYHLKDISSIDELFNNIDNPTAMRQFTDFYEYICEIQEVLDRLYNDIEEKHTAIVK